MAAKKKTCRSKYFGSRCVMKAGHLGKCKDETGMKWKKRQQLKDQKAASREFGRFIDQEAAAFQAQADRFLALAGMAGATPEEVEARIEELEAEIEQLEAAGE